MTEGGRIDRGDRPASEYRERPPPPALARHLVCTWTQSIGDGIGDHPQRVLPDGCVDIVWIGDAAPVIAGPATRTFVAPLPPRAIVVGARFRPGRAPGLLGLPANELLNAEVPLRAVWGGAADDLAARVAGRRSAEARLAAVEAALAGRLADARPADELVAAAVAWLARHPAGRVDRLSRSLGISDRQLRRRFRAAVGYGPKALHRILRFQRTLVLAAGAPAGRAGLAALAADAGYADQAHMTREILELAGRPPSALLPRARSAITLSDLFKTADDPAD